VVDVKGMTIQTATDKSRRWRRIVVNRQFTEIEMDAVHSLVKQCFDKAFL
jgi:hypothetical protein